MPRVYALCAAVDREECVLHENKPEASGCRKGVGPLTCREAAARPASASRAQPVRCCCDAIRHATPRCGGRGSSAAAADTALPTVP